jgi:carbonic anhydrase
VFRTPNQASADQIRRFTALFPMNAWSVLPVNRRFVLETG